MDNLLYKGTNLCNCRICNTTIEPFMSFGQMPLANGFLNPEQFDKEYFFELKVSFYPVKNLGAIGDGGMVVTDNSEMAEKAKLLREYGWAERYMSHLKNFGGSND